jgi:ABC-type maltose transport system permease subunit
MSKALSISKTHGLILSIIVLVVVAFASIAYANPFYNGPRAASATATTTVTYMTPGTATTTVVYDSYEKIGTNQKVGGDTTLPNFVAVAVQGVSSSSISVLNIACEYSSDNLDWYQNDLFAATSSGVMPIAAPSTFSYTFASTTLNGVAYGNKFAKIVQCPVPLQYVRAVVTNTGANLSQWTAIYPVKQRQ